MNLKKTTERTLLALAVVLFAAIAGAYAIVHTGAFNRFVLSKLTQLAQKYTGSPVHIARMTIHLDRLSVDLYGVSLDGNETYAQTPFFSAGHLGVSVEIVSLLKRQFRLRAIVLDRPVVHLFVDAAGRTNAPKPPSRSGETNAANTIVNLAIQDFTLRSGEIDLNDRKIPVSAELHDLRSYIRFDNFKLEYRGSMEYKNGRITAQNYAPIEHSARLRFTMGRSGLAFKPILIASGASRVWAEANLTNYSQPDVRGDYRISVDTKDLAATLSDAWLLRGTVTATGTFHYESGAGRGAIENTEISGSVASRELVLRARQLNAVAERVRASYRLRGGELDIGNFQANVLGGIVTADLHIALVGRHPLSRLNVSLRNVSLEEASGLLPSQAADRLHLLGRADGAVRARWTNAHDLRGHTRLVLSDPPRRRSGNYAIPVSGVVDVSYDAASDIASFGESHLRTGNTAVSLTGTLSKKAELNVQASTRDLREVGALVSEVMAAMAPESSSGANAVQRLGLRGSARFNGQVLGSLENPRIQGQLSAEDLGAEGSTWRSLRAGIDISPSGAEFHSGVLENGPRSQVTFDGRVGLVHWSFTPASAVNIRSTVKGIPIADLERVVNLNYPITGNLSAQFALAGSRENPAGSGSLEITKGSAWNQPIDSLRMNFQLGGQAIHSTARLQLSAGIVAGNLAYSFPAKSYQASVTTSGLRLDEIHAVRSRGLPVRGVLAVSANGRGTLKSPQLTASFQVPELRVMHQTVSDVRGQLGVNGLYTNFLIDASADRGRVQAKGDVELTGNYPSHATLDVRSLPLQTLLAAHLPEQRGNLQGETDAHATLSGPLKTPRAMQAQVTIPALSFGYRAVRLALVRPLNMHYDHGVLRIAPAELKGTGTDIKVQGQVPIKGAGAVSVSANGTVDLSILQNIAPGVKSSGQLAIDLSASGAGRSFPASMHGEVRIVNAALSTATIPLGIEKLNAVFRVSNDRLVISQFAAAAGGGQLTAQGSVVYAKQPTFNLVLDAKGVRLRYPEGIRSVLDGNLQLNGTPANSALTGRVLLNSLSFTQQFDIASLIGRFSGEPSGSSPSELERNTKLNVTLQSTRELNLASSKLSMRGAANLNITGTLANPVILGRATLASGEIFFMGKRYQVQSGTIEFSNPVRTEPVVNVYVSTRVQQYDITMNFVGPTDRLRTTYTSVPALSPADIINLLAFGKTTEEAAAAGSTPASVGAESVLAQGVSGQVSTKLENLTGISQLTINPMAGSTSSDPSAQLAIQERVTGSILLTFSTNVTSTQNTAVQVQYRVSPQISVSVLRDQNGGYAVDVRLRKTF